jgi:ABC-type lipoprotein export system ATPase subunit/acyl-CoA-binding protein
MAEFSEMRDAEFKIIVEGIMNPALLGGLKMDTKKEIYSLSRQGLFGDNTEAKPGMLAIKEGFKWKAWNTKKGMARPEAKQLFLELITREGIWTAPIKSPVVEPTVLVSAPDNLNGDL